MADKSGLQTLITRQDQYLRRIIKELLFERKKTTDWIWWVFPTQVQGKSEPPLDGKKSYLTKGTVHEFLEHVEMSGQWQYILEKIVELAYEAEGLEYILDPADMGRVEFFVDFWATIDPYVMPQWLHNVLVRLAPLVYKEWKNRPSRAMREFEAAQLEAAIAASNAITAHDEALKAAYHAPANAAAADASQAAAAGPANADASQEAAAAPANALTLAAADASQEAAAPPKRSETRRAEARKYGKNLETLLEMGVEPVVAENALEAANGDMDVALNILDEYLQRAGGKRLRRRKGKTRRRKRTIRAQRFVARPRLR